MRVQWVVPRWRRLLSWATRSPELMGRRLTLGEAWSGWIEIARHHD